MSSLTDGQVEKAARALFLSQRPMLNWDKLGPDRSDYLLDARRVLEAVADDIAREALEGATVEYGTDVVDSDLWSGFSRLVTPWKPVEKETPDA